MNRLAWSVVVGFSLANAVAGCGFPTDQHCVEGNIQPCGTSTGQCQPGQQVCMHGAWSACSGTMPKEEVCNGLDDNCDGTVDEGCHCEDGDELECGDSLGLCKPGVQRCKDGRWGSCEDVSPDKKRVGPQSEVCDGQDNDCDGDIDEGCDCRHGATRWCNGGLGVCQSGQQTCVS